MTSEVRRKWLIAIVAAGLALSLLAVYGGRWLVDDSPRRSDAILVLAGETNRRPERALELLQQGYGRRVVLDVPSGAKIYDFTELTLAQRYIDSLPRAADLEICAIEGLSTRDEARDAERCLARIHASSVLIVTSDFHTRRALSVFRRVIPGMAFSVAASRDDVQFGQRWWTHRQWAKTAVDESLKWLWWEGVDRWR